MSERVNFELMGWCDKLEENIPWDECQTCDYNNQSNYYDKVVECGYKEMVSNA